MENILEVKNLTTCFYEDGRELAAVDDVSFSIAANSVVGVVGESGCGKTMTALSLTKLLPKQSCRIVRGSVHFKNADILKLSDEELRSIRGRKIAYVFQEPSTSLNPVLTIQEQIEEVLILHRQDIAKDQRRKFVISQLENVGIKNAGDKVNGYPHQLSGGEKQRVMIAMAMASGPEILIADEPTTALDVTVQAQILELLKKLRAGAGIAVFFISHDLNVIADISDVIMVMYAGQVVEMGKAGALLNAPRHPYTQGLLAALPDLRTAKKEKLNPIPGDVPKLKDLPCACRFHPRCPKVFEKCRKEMPTLFKQKDGSEVRCWLYSD